MLNPGLETDNEKNSRWFGCGYFQHENKFIRLVHLSLQFFIWECKLKRVIPTGDFILGETVLLLDNACSLNANLKNCRIISNCPLSRHWQNIRALTRHW